MKYLLPLLFAVLLLGGGCARRTTPPTTAPSSPVETVPAPTPVSSSPEQPHESSDDLGDALQDLELLEDVE